MSVSSESFRERAVFANSNISNQEHDVQGVQEVGYSKNRIFINHVDMFNSKHITEYLTDQTLESPKRNLSIAGEEDQNEENMEIISKQGQQFECIGTMQFPINQPSEDISYIVYDADANSYSREILNAGCVIFDITQDPKEIPKALAALNLMVEEIESVKQIGPKTFNRYDREFLFILISNVLTWGKTKPIDRNDPEVPFTEADYRKRKASANYSEMLACEREVVQAGRKYKNILKTYVICCGFTYGFEEETLMFFFKMAWQYKDVPILLPGNNYLPVIHIEDVAKVIQAVIQLQPKKQYILAVEQIPSRPSKIMRALTYYMGRDVIEVSKEEAFLHNNISQHLFDIMTINLKMEPAYIIDELGVQFRSDLNLVQNMGNIVMEFRTARNLFPMKVLVHGPIASGKTTLARQLEEYYGLHYVDIKSMIEESKEILQQQINAEMATRKARTAPTAYDGEVGGEGAEDEFAPVVNVEALQEQLNELTQALMENNGRLSDAHVLKLMRWFLGRNICQNQGYILDNYPQTMEECKELFGGELDRTDIPGEGEAEGEDAAPIAPRRTITPQFVITLEADDEFLVENMMNYPEWKIDKSNEESLLKHLREFRDNNTEDNTLLNFFDEHEIHPININIPTWCKDYTGLLVMLKNILGVPFGFELSAEEQIEFIRCQEEAERLKEEQADIERELLERQALNDYEEKMEERIRILDELQKEEEKVIMVQCEPLRHYLMMHVFPTLTSGLLEIARVKPNDPVDYLAEYLFKFNPEGKMFEPTYSARGEEVQNGAKSMNAIQKNP